MSKSPRDIPWIDKREGVYYVFWYDPSKKRTERASLRTSDAVEAQVRFAAFLAEGIATTKPVGAAGLNVSAALDHYFFEHAKKNCADWVRQEVAIRHLKAFFGSMPMRDVDALKTQMYLQARKTGAVCGSSGRKSRKGSDSTVRRELNTLIAAANHCVFFKHMKQDEMPTVDLPKEVRAESEEALWYTKEELSTLIGVARGDLKDFIVLAYYTGARREAIETLTVEQVKFDQRRVFLLKPGQRQTTKRKAVVPIYPEMEEVLRRRIGDRKAGNVFMPARDMYRPFRELCESIGLDHKRNPHILRHSRATHLLMDGKPIYAVAKLLGDTVATVERVYGHACSSFLEDLR